MILHTHDVQQWSSSAFCNLDVVTMNNKSQSVTIRTIILTSLLRLEQKRFRIPSQETMSGAKLINERFSLCNVALNKTE